MELDDLDMMEEQGQEAMDYGGPPIEKPELKDWFGSFVTTEWKTQDSLRQDKVDQQSFAYRVMKGMDCQEAGHNEVAPEHRHKEMLMARLFTVWPGSVTGRIFPDGSRWLSVESPVPDDLGQEELAAAGESIFWSKLMEDGENFGDEATQIVYESGYGFGCIVRVSPDYVVDPDTGKSSLKICRRTYPFKDFVLDKNCPDWRKSFVILRHRYSREQILALSEPVYSEDGEMVRGPVFDKEQVRLMLERNAEGYTADGNPTLSSDRTERDGSSSGANRDYFDCLEYLGPMTKDGKVVDKNMMVTVCNGICLRAKGMEGGRKWVLFGSIWGSLDDPYPESKGFHIASLENKINLYETAAAFAQMVSVFGVQTFDTNRADVVAQWGKSYTLAPGRQVPDIFKMLEYKADTSTIQRIKQDNTKSALEYMGVSNQALAGLPQSNVTATESAGVQQGAESRIGYDARHYSGPFNELMQIMWRCLLDNMEEEEAVMEDGRVIPVEGEWFRDFKGTLSILSIGNSNAAGIKAQQLQAAMPFLQAAGQAGLVDMREAYKLFFDRAIGLPRVVIKKLMPEPQPMEQMAEPPVDEFPMNPDGTPMLQVVNQ